MSGAVVTDSTFHIELAYPAGTFDYYVWIDGKEEGDESGPCVAYEFTGTITITDPTPARRVTLGAAKVRWKP